MANITSRHLMLQQANDGAQLTAIRPSAVMASRKQVRSNNKLNSLSTQLLYSIHLYAIQQLCGQRIEFVTCACGGCHGW